MEKRLETNRAFLGVRTKMVLLREKLIENCMGTLKAQDAFAVEAIECLARKAAVDGAGAAPDPPPEVRPGLDGEKNSIAALEKACRLRMNQLLADPAQMSLPAIRGLEAALELVGDLKWKLSRREDNGPSQSPPARAEAEMRRQIPGMSPEQSWRHRTVRWAYRCHKGAIKVP
jgi:hypothetical protein